MSKFWFQSALIANRWQQQVELSINEDGLIHQIQSGSAPSADAEALPGLVIPAIANVHSHAFQFRFAGQSEFRTGEHDSFWSWREQMYASLKGFDPEIAFANATRLYRLMRQHGYSTVGEFHYVHNDEMGQPHSQPAALADAHVRAAVDVGIRICILPVLYQRGGFDGSPIVAAQLRFATSDDQFLNVVNQLHRDWSDHPLVTVGMAFHSLRAVDRNKLESIVKQFDLITSGGPIHIHVAEQHKEVNDCLLATGKRPVELLFEHAEVNDRWCLIHATHMSESEIKQVAKSGAVVGLCPTTEANLGDGIFPAEAYLAGGGKFAIGGDSHVSVCPFSELRLLEYGQRLTTNRRAVLCNASESCGHYLYRKAIAGGAKAMGQEGPAGLAVGGRADLILIGDHPGIADVPVEHLLSRLVFGQYGNPIERVMVAGRWIP